MSKRIWAYTPENVRDHPQKLKLFLHDLESWQRSWYPGDRTLHDSASQNMLGMFLDELVVPFLEGSVAPPRSDYAAVDPTTGRVILLGSLEEMRALPGDSIITHLPTGALVDVGMLP